MSRDHFVPQVYLRNFTDDEGKFYRWMTKTELPIIYRFPSQDCWIQDYYDVVPDLQERHKITDPKVIEHHFFKNFEEGLGDIVQRLEARAKRIPFKMLVTLCRGYILQHIRTPFYQKGVEHIDKTQGAELKRGAWQNMRDEFSPQIAKTGHPNASYYLSDEFWENVYKNILSTPLDGRGTQQHSLIHTVSGMSDTANNAVNRLLMMDFRVLIAAKDCYFITSDNPGISVIPDNLIKSYRTHSYSFDAMSGIIYPLTNQLVVQLFLNPPVYTTESDRNVKYIQLTEEDTYKLNRDIHFHSDEKVFCCDKDYLIRFKNRVLS